MQAYKVLNPVGGGLYSGNPPISSIREWLAGKRRMGWTLAYPMGQVIKPLKSSWLFVFAELEWAVDWASTEQEIWEVEVDQLKTVGQVGMQWLKISFPPPGTHFCKELRLIKKIK